MCQGIALPISELPESWLKSRPQRIFLREPTAAREWRFLFRDAQPELPVWLDGRLTLVAWGNRSNKSRLPRGGWSRHESLASGLWSNLRTELVDVPATLGVENGIWYLIPEGGVRGLIAFDERNQPHAYVLTRPASHYYRVMTRSFRMPIFVGEKLESESY